MQGFTVLQYIFLLKDKKFIKLVFSTSFIRSMKITGAFFNPNGQTTSSKRFYFVSNPVSNIESASILVGRFSDHKSIFGKYFAPDSWPKML